MDRYQMNRSYSRPYQSTCGRNGDSDSRRSAGRMERRNDRRMQRVESAREENRMDEGCSCRLPETESRPCRDTGIQNAALGGLPLAMAYVPMQECLRDTYELDDALRLGTIFPELCKPFCGCGKRGGSR